MKRYIDACAALWSREYQTRKYEDKTHEGDLELVFERAGSHGVTHIIVGCKNITQSTRMLQLASNRGRVFCTVGLSADDLKKTHTTKRCYMKCLRKLVKTHRLGSVVAVGECGLPRIPHKEDIRILQKQLYMASFARLPVMLRCPRFRHDELLGVLAKFKKTIPAMILLDFLGTQDNAQPLLDAGLYLSVGVKSVNDIDTLETLKHLPLDKLIVQSGNAHEGCLNDHKDVSTKFSCKTRRHWQPGYMLQDRNEPVSVVQVVEVLAAVRGEDVAVVARQLYKNALSVFLPEEESCSSVL